MTQHFLQEGSERSRSEPIGAERSRAEPSGAEPNYMIIFMHVMGTSLRGFSYGFRYNLIGHLVTTTSRRDQLAPIGPSSTRTSSLCVAPTRPPVWRVPSPSLEIGYADRRLGGASVWFIHNPNAISSQLLLASSRWLRLSISETLSRRQRRRSPQTARPGAKVEPGASGASHECEASTPRLASAASKEASAGMASAAR